MPRYYPADHMRAAIDNRFKYHEPQANQIERYNDLRSGARTLALMILSHTPPSREQSLALTKLEEAIFFANAAIARNETSANDDIGDAHG